MTAKRTDLSFLDTHSTELAHHVVAIDPEKRLELLFLCFDQFPRHILEDADVVDAITALRNIANCTDEKIRAISDKANKMTALSIEADDMGNEEQGERLDQIGSILSAVSFAIRDRPLSAFYADKALYYMYEVLTEDFVRRLIDSTR